MFHFGKITGSRACAREPVNYELEQKMNINRQPRTKFWILQIAPPLLLIYMCWVPNDIGANMLGIPGFIGFLVSLVTLPKKLYKAKKYHDDIRTATRPALTILIMLVALNAVEFSYKKAIRQVTAEAEIIQEECIKNGSCPAVLQGWEEHWKGYGKITKEFGAQIPHRARYTVGKDGKEFSIYLRKNIDRGYTIEGGVGKQIQAYKR